MSVRKRLDNEKSKENIDVDALIDKGAKVKADHISEKKKWININLRIAVTMLSDIDNAVDERVGITRTGWILEAIHEKLQGKK